VINFDVPRTPEAYTHRIGRTGRAELEGVACTFVTSDDRAWVQRTERMIGAPIPRRRVEGFEPDSGQESGSRRNGRKSEGRRFSRKPESRRNGQKSESRRNGQNSGSRRNGQKSESRRPEGKQQSRQRNASSRGGARRRRTA
jgi:ATP-dependent RNA helicase RhlE